MGILQKVKTKIAIKYSCLGIDDYTVIPEHYEMYCIDHIIYDGNVYALCIFKGILKAVNVDDLFYYDCEKSI